MKKILFIQKVRRGNPGNADSEYMPVFLAKSRYASVSMIALSGGDASYLRNHNVEVIEAPVNLNWYRTLSGVSRRLKPDIVHVYIHAFCGSYPIIMRSKNDTKFILDIRSPLLRSGFRRNLVRIKDRFEPMLYDAISSTTQETAWTRVSTNKEINVIPPGIDLQAIHERSRKQIENKPIRIIYIGSLRSIRNIPLMVKAVISVSHRCPIEFDIYGDGEDTDLIESMAKLIDPGSKMCVKRIIPREDLFNLLVEYDIGLSYVPKHLYDPAPPLKTLEYLACGLAVVATNTKGNSMLIKNGVNGLLVNEDETSFANGILTVANNSSIRNSFHNSARDSVEQYSWEKIINNRLIPLYENLNV